MPVPTCPILYWAERGVGGETMHVVETSKTVLTKESTKRNKKDGHESPSIGKDASGRGKHWTIKLGKGWIRGGEVSVGVTGVGL